MQTHPPLCTDEWMMMQGAVQRYLLQIIFFQQKMR